MPEVFCLTKYELNIEYKIETRRATLRELTILGGRTMVFVMFSFKVQVGNESIESPVMGAGDIDLLQELFSDNLIWDCKKSELGNQMYPTVKEMKALYCALLKYSATHEISAKVFATGNLVGCGPLVKSSAKSLFRDLIKFCEEKLGFKKSKKMQAALARREKQNAQNNIAKAKRVRKGAFVVQTRNSIYDIGPADELGKRSIVRRGRPLSDTTTGRITFVRKGKQMLFFLDGDCDEYQTSKVQFIESAK